MTRVRATLASRQRLAPSPAAVEPANRLVLATLLMILLWPRFLFLPVGGVGLSPFTLSMLIMLMIALPKLFLTADRPTTDGFPLASILTALFVFTILIADFNGEIPLASLSSSLRMMLSVYGAFPIGAVFFSRRSVIAAIPRIFTFVAFITSMIGIAERLSGRSLLSVIGADRFAAGAEFVSFIATGSFRDGEFRASSLFSHSIVFGQFIAASFPFALILISRRRSLDTLLGLGAIALIPFAIIASGSRSPLIVLFASLMTMAGLYLWTKFRSSGALALFGAVGVIGLLIVTLLGDDLKALVIGRNPGEMNSSEARDIMIQTGLSALSRSPLFGFGEGMSVLKAGSTTAGGGLTIDNLYLTIAVDFGYVGLFLFIAMAVAICFAGCRKFALCRDEDVSRALAGMVSFCVAIFVGQYIMSIWDNITLCMFFGGAFAASTPGATTRKMAARSHATAIRALPNPYDRNKPDWTAPRP